MNEKIYIDFYKEFVQKIKENSVDYLNRNRDSAFENFEKKGFPADKDEQYRYSRLASTLSIDFGLNINRLKFQIDKNILYRCKIPSINSVSAFMVNDNFYFPENQKLSLPQGIVFCPLSDAEKFYPKVVKKYLFSQSKKSEDSFTNFNSAFVQDGYFLYIQQNTVFEHPLQLINLLHCAQPLMTFAHNLIVVESGAAAKMLLCEHAADDIDFFASRITEIFVENNAKFEYYSLENTNRKTNISSQIFVNQKDNSNVVINSVGLNNAVSRNSVFADIDGQHSELFLGGMLISDGNQETENFTLIRHKQPNSVSNELFKYILDEKSRGIFSGKIIVEKDAQRTQSRQTNKNICLTEEAVIHSRPQLEIYADDVKCGHGATTGQLDNCALFYLQSRGISKDEAQLMLLAAFVQDVLENINIEVLRERLTLMVEKRLKKDSYHCRDCFIC
ncbi:MAG: Fe-S cluster assembly protein SufD [Prevotellaceae bacterium]|jgi:Fe-S cluster assembly protein SufD|nr:Fe-S cluster assembly protein SufD [Prevotellaceae bacterium]